MDPLTATGPAALEIFDHPDLYAGSTLPVVGDVLSPLEMVETFRRVTGRKAEYRSAYTRDELLRYFPGLADNEALVQEFLGMVQYAVEYGYYQSQRDLGWSRRVDPASLDWEGFLRRTGWSGEKRSFGAGQG